MSDRPSIRFSFVTSVILFLSGLIIWSVTQPDIRVFGQPATTLSSGKKTDSLKKNFLENERCLKCHGDMKYHYINPSTGKGFHKKMYTELIIPRVQFYLSNHRSLKCIDCHSEDYRNFPHDGNLRTESIPACVDCHSDDKKLAGLKFEEVDTAFLKSVHSPEKNSAFSCWMCHNAHTNKIYDRLQQSVNGMIKNDNSVCLGCHGDLSKVRQFTENKHEKLIKKHDWLPNQSAHFTYVKCVECHSVNEDSLPMAHLILPGSKSVRQCETCHSKNSALRASLCSYYLKSNINESGVIKGFLFSKTCSIGPDNDNTLNIISLVVFGITLSGIILHITFRIISSRKE